MTNNDKQIITLSNTYTSHQYPEGYTVPAPYVVPVVLLLLQTRWYVINEGMT